MGKYYVITVFLKNTPKDDFLVDNLFKVDKNVTKIVGFNISEDRDAYFAALKKPIYLQNA